MVDGCTREVIRVVPVLLQPPTLQGDEEGLGVQLVYAPLLPALVEQQRPELVR